MAIEIKGSTPEFFSTALSEHVRIKKMRACKSAGIALYKTWRGWYFFRHQTQDLIGVQTGLLLSEDKAEDISLSRISDENRSIFNDSKDGILTYDQCREEGIFTQYTSGLSIFYEPEKEGDLSGIISKRH